MISGIGFIFPGQGSQGVGMGREFYERDPEARAVFAQAGQALGFDLAALCFNGPIEQLNLTEFTQPALLTVSVIALRGLDRAGIRPIAVAGHSLGEFSALVAAGGLAFPDAVVLVRKRGRYMQEAVPAGRGLVYALLGVDGSVVAEVCREASALGVVAPANFNGPGQIVIAGEKAAVEEAVRLAKAKGCRKTVPLPVSVPVHTSLMREAADRLAVDVARVPLNDLTVPLVNNADAKPIRTASDVRASLVRQLASPVLWEDSVRGLRRIGVRTLVEVGPGKVLTGLAKRIDPELRLLNVQDPASLAETVEALAA
ncbi:MAG TPA: ACP S-malonyltransferase [Nitrospirales bacterium]|nr:ACP S-malonyltransferase [Nitrospirales bacterium]